MKALIESLFDSDLVSRDSDLYVIELVDHVEFISLGNRNVIEKINVDAVEKAYKSIPKNLVSNGIEKIDDFDNFTFRDPSKQEGCDIMKKLIYILTCSIKIQDVYNFSKNKINWNKFEKIAESILSKYILDGIELDMMLGYDTKKQLCQFTFGVGMYSSMFFKLMFKHTL